MDVGKSKTAQFFVDLHGKTSLSTAIETAARALRSALLPQYPELPVDVEDIARACGIRFSNQPLMGSCPEGLLVPDGGYFLLRLRTGVAPARRRFSIAHEIGHTFFYKRGVGGLRHQVGILSEQELKAEEAICDQFARALLVPPEFLVSFFKQTNPCSAWDFLRLTEDIARKLHVSIPVVVSRLQDVAVDAPAAIMLVLTHRPHSQRQGESQLRVNNVGAIGPAKGRIWVWRNKTARSLGLEHAETLYRRWSHEGTEGQQITLAGRFTLDAAGDLVRVTDSAAAQHIKAWLRVSEFNSGRWYKPLLDADIADCLYARPKGEIKEAYVVSAWTGPALVKATREGESHAL
jgi:hypothetical protein